MTELSPAIIKEATSFRKALHANPELSGNEVHTIRKIRDFLEPLQADALLPVGQTGLAAIFKGFETGETVLIRGDIDALPIEENLKISHQSQVPGVSHKCGHDGHTAILIGLARQLAAQRPARGQAVLLFQPAEETGAGALQVLQDPEFEHIQPDWAFALHNLPGYPAGQVIVREGSFTAAVSTLILKFEGKTAHAAEPENGFNPVYALGEIIHQLKKREVPQADNDAFTLITPVYLNAGELAYGTAAGKGEIHLTVRCWDTQRLRNTIADLTQIAGGLASENQLQLSATEAEYFPANSNDAASVSIIQKAAEVLNIKTLEPPTPMRWGEDFGHISGQYKGAMFGLGAGESHPPLHHPDYDFPDALLAPGIQMFQTIIHQILG